MLLIMLLSMLLLMLLLVMFMLYRSPNALGNHPVPAIVPRHFKIHSVRSEDYLCLFSGGWGWVVGGAFLLPRDMGSHTTSSEVCISIFRWWMLLYKFARLFCPNIQAFISAPETFEHILYCSLKVGVLFKNLRVLIFCFQYFFQNGSSQLWAFGSSEAKHQNFTVSGGTS